MARSRVMPHVKTFARYRPEDASVAWVILGSHNLSGAAWGRLEKNGAQVNILSYELELRPSWSPTPSARGSRRRSLSPPPRATPPPRPARRPASRGASAWPPRGLKSTRTRPPRTSSSRRGRWRFAPRADSRRRRRRRRRGGGGGGPARKGKRRRRLGAVPVPAAPAAVRTRGRTVGGERRVRGFGRVRPSHARGLRRDVAGRGGGRDARSNRH